MPRRTAEKKSYPSAVAVERAADIMALLAERGQASVTELAVSADITVSAVHRILMALKRKRLVEQDPVSERYALSWAILGLARTLVNRDELRALALPFMVEIRDATNETVSLYVRSGFERVCVEQVESTQEIRYRTEVGRYLPLYVGASGLALLAFLPPDELDEYLATVERPALTPFTITDRGKLERKLAKIREQGYATASQDRVLGLSGLSAPIVGASGEVNSIITIAGPTQRMTEEAVRDWIRVLTESTREISSRLSGSLEQAPRIARQQQHGTRP